LRECIFVVMEVVVQRNGDVIIPERNIKIVEDYSNGKSIKEIAKEQDLSFRTVEAIFNKLRYQFGCKNIVHLVSTLLRKGVIK
jgi:DNA-binding NarL/FixJ family response regulator